MRGFDENEVEAEGWRPAFLSLFERARGGCGVEEVDMVRFTVDEAMESFDSRLGFCVVNVSVDSEVRG